MKLQKLTMPSFNEDLNYPMDKFLGKLFIYTSTIHECTSLADIDKFKYLQQSLNGPAFETIAGLPISYSNYKEAIDLVQKHYGSKQILISK